KALEEQLVPIPVRLNKALMNELDAEEQQQMLKLLQKVVAAI
ncbi:MarR family transcriptional regulator, partial [Vibrio splendidus]